jgi:hypothetical protein
MRYYHGRIPWVLEFIPTVTWRSKKHAGPHMLRNHANIDNSIEPDVSDRPMYKSLVRERERLELNRENK